MKGATFRRNTAAQSCSTRSWKTTDVLPRACVTERPGDRERYRRLQQAFGGQPVASITPAAIELFRDELSRDHAPATVNRHLQLLRAVFLRAVRDGKVTFTPTNRVKFYRENNKRERYLSDEEERRLYASLPSWLHPVVTVALHTGLRKSELLGLRWDDVHFISGTIIVREPKSGENEHVIMNDTVLRELEHCRRRARK